MQVSTTEFCFHTKEKFWNEDGEQKERENCNVMSALQPEIAFFLFARPHSYSQTHEMDKTRTLLQKTLEYETTIQVYIPNNLTIHCIRCKWQYELSIDFSIDINVKMK